MLDTTVEGEDSQGSVLAVPFDDSVGDDEVDGHFAMWVIEPSHFLLCHVVYNFFVSIIQYTLPIKKTQGDIDFFLYRSVY
jgi:hypothetical protein